MATKKKRTKKPKPEILTPVFIPDNDPFSKASLLTQMRSLGALPPDELSEVIDRQIDVILAAANSVSIEQLRGMIDKEATVSANVGRSMILRNVSNLMDGMSRQRLVLSKLREEAPGDTAKNRMLIPPELNDKDWEKKYAGTFAFGKKAN